MVNLHTLAFGLLSVAAQTLALQTIKVMPFGASIVSRCWRANLQTMLRDDKTTNFDFVGTQTGTCSGTSDQDHEGHPGSQATDYARNGNLTGWLNANSPDVVIMLLGTNDVLIGRKPVGDILKAYDVLIGQMRQNKPTMRIIFSNLLPLDTKRWPQSAADGIIQLNAAIRQYAPTKNTSVSPVVFVDNFDAFDPVADTTDGQHPNSSGNDKIAKKFFAPTRDAIKAIAPIGSGTTSDTSQSKAQPSETTSPKGTSQASQTTPAKGTAQALGTISASMTVYTTSQLQSSTEATLGAKTSGTAQAQATIVRTSQGTTLRAHWLMRAWISARLIISMDAFK